ncbi:hypothetical protein N7532_001348 [Penicillium argentinense]|uniref:EGF-like domain-containing protein n=1 Tax=Penicillium argentinense TaxID=1131581 RepID=A0A9W9G2E7_9EURO|nr:uncharacterized protein N7532_001348 [Penicillium argentinense]KAJ5110813.1 hypothetical protein N7532_001348 [Penicillium argentinense]
MSSNFQGSHGPGPRPGPRPAGPEPDRKGSVKRARELLEAGVRPKRTSTTAPVPALQPRPFPPPPRNASHQTQWPLPATGLQPRPLNPQQHPRYVGPRGPPPQRPPRPSEVPSQIPSPSIYSVRSGLDSETSSNYPYPTRPARSFSQPKLVVQNQHPPRPSTADGSCPSPTSTVDLTPRISIATDDLFRHSTASGSSSVPDVPPVPLPESPQPLANAQQRKTAGLAAPSAHKARARRSSVSPIPEELPDPRQTLGSLASSRAIPSSWGSGPAESEILGAYLDIESDGEGSADHRPVEENAALVRSASLGKRGKPTMRTILKSNTGSEVSIPDAPTQNKENENSQNEKPGKAIIAPASIGQVLRAPSPRRKSVSTVSGESFIDPEKPRFAQPAQVYHNAALEKELEVLPAAAPTMSDKRPGGRKPPRLDMGAVRDAEARGSLSSLTDLIRRATKLATNLDHGRTASRTDLVASEADRRGPFGRRRNSGSISDILNSFPNPALATPDENRGSWPVFFGRSNLRNGEALASNEDEAKHQKASRKCCGMPRKWFIILCIVLFIIVILAILLPVFLVAVPNEKSKNDDTTSCAKSNPCSNGGVSVSSGTQCSCVCSNGYTGSTCTAAGDSSCVNSDVDNGTISKKATMGSSLPALFNESDSKFGITLDSVTIMALFSMNNISCKTENALIAFSDVDRSSSSSGKIRRSVDLETAGTVDSTAADSTNDKPMGLPIRPADDATPIALAARSMATTNGILYDNSGNRGEPSKTTSTTSDSQGTATTTGTSTATSITSTSSAKARSTGVPDDVVEFSQIAVLYIMQETGSFDSALSSEKEIETYLTESYANTSYPTMELMGTFALDFANKTITLDNGDGKTVH